MPEVTNTVLQTVALSLPAIALYMTVLNELYQIVDEAQKVHTHPESPSLDPHRPAGGRDEIEVNRGFVTYSTAMKGTDFRLAVVSLSFLILATIALIIATASTLSWIRWIGVGLSIVGFATLVAALIYTAYASFRQLYPQ